MESYLQALIDYFSAHPNIALGAVFAASLLEALAVIGTVIPGSSIVFVGGVLIGLGALNPWWTTVIALVGAIMGDGISYWLGHHFHERIRTLWPMKNYPRLFDRGHLYFKKNGGKSVFFGRFLGPVRAIVPVVAGMAGMPATQFYVLNVLSALAWAAAHLLPGVLFGASLQLAGAVSSRLVVVLLLVAAVFWAVSKLFQLSYRQGWSRLRQLRDLAVEQARRKPGVFANFVQSLLDPSKPESSALLIAAVLLIGGTWLFLGILEDVLSSDPLIQFDQTVYAVLQSLRTDGGDLLMVAITEGGGAVGTAVLLIGVSMLLAIRRNWRTLVYWLAAVGVAEIFVWTLKYTLGRARPHNIYAGVEQFSFPSGHTTTSIVVYGFLAFLLSRGKTDNVKIALTLLAASIITLIAFSRIYLGVHWFSDILGSIGLGLAWMALISTAYVYHVPLKESRSWPFLLVVVASLCITGGFYAGDRYRTDVERYTYQPALETKPLDNWTGTGWTSLPKSRLEIGGEAEERLSVQWAGTAGQISDTLEASGWQAPESWTLKTSLLWLLPTAQIQQLPVLPKFDHGLVQKITFVKGSSSGERLVIRLWPLPLEVKPEKSSSRPLWIGMVTAERLSHPVGMITLAKTEADLDTPLRVLVDDVKNQKLTVQSRKSYGITLELVW